MEFWHVQKPNKDSTSDTFGPNANVFFHKFGPGDVKEIASALIGKSFGEHRLSSSGRPIQQDSLSKFDSFLSEDRGVEEIVPHFHETGLGFSLANNVLEKDLFLSVKFDFGYL